MATHANDAATCTGRADQSPSATQTFEERKTRARATTPAEERCCRSAERAHRPLPAVRSPLSGQTHDADVTCARRAAVHPVWIPAGSIPARLLSREGVFRLPRAGSLRDQSAGSRRCAERSKLARSGEWSRSRHVPPIMRGDAPGQRNPDHQPRDASEGRLVRRLLVYVHRSRTLHHVRALDPPEQVRVTSAAA